MSSRERLPLTGRSNYTARSSVRGSARSTARSESTFAYDPRNDTLAVNRPFTPESPRITTTVNRRAIPRGIPLVTSPDPSDRIGQTMMRKHKTCPDRWLSESNVPSWLETCDMKKMVDERWKTQMAREFVTRNQERLWMFDRAYMGQTPRAVCDDIVGRLNYMSTMKMFNKIENKLKQLTTCLN